MCPILRFHHQEEQREMELSFSTCRTPPTEYLPDFYSAPQFHLWLHLLAPGFGRPYEQFLLRIQTILVCKPAVTSIILKTRTVLMRHVPVNQRLEGKLQLVFYKTDLEKVVEVEKETELNNWRKRHTKSINLT